MIEVLIALAVASFCLLSIYGLLSTALSINQNLILQTEATQIVCSVVEDISSTPSTATSSPRFQINLPTSGSAVGTTATLYFDQDGNNLPASSVTNAVYSVSIMMTPPTQATQKQPTVLGVVAYWPPYSDSETTSQVLAQHSVQFTTEIDRN